LDYCDIEIEQAIQAVISADIRNGCLNSPNYPNGPFCEQFERRADGGLSDLTTGQINFARQQADGIDFSVAYEFSVDEDNFGISLVGSRQNSLNNFFNPLDLNDVNPELEEVQVPKTSGNLTLSWDRGPLAVAFQTTYQSRQSVDEIEVVLGLNGNNPLYGDDGFFDSVTIFDITASYEFDDNLTVFGGINNIGDEEPFATQTAWPVGPRGRTLFLGASYRL